MGRKPEAKWRQDEGEVELRWKPDRSKAKIMIYLRIRWIKETDK